MFGKDIVDDGSGALLVAVYLVAVYAVGVHACAVAYDVFQHGGREVFVHHGYKGVAQLMDGTVNAMLGAVGAPMVPQMIREGWLSVLLREEVCGSDSFRGQHGCLVRKNLFCTLGEVYLPLGVFCFSGGYLPKFVDGATDGDVFAVIVLFSQAAQLAGATADDNHETKSMDVIGGEWVSVSGDGVFVK